MRVIAPSALVRCLRRVVVPDGAYILVMELTRWASTDADAISEQAAVGVSRRG